MVRIRIFIYLFASILIAWSCSQVNVLNNDYVTLDEIKNKKGLQFLYKAPYGSTTTQDEGVLFVMVDSIDNEYHLLMTESLSGGRNSIRSVSLDTSFNSPIDSNIIEEKLQIQDSTYFVEYSFRLKDETVVEYCQNQMIGIYYDIKGEYLTLETRSGDLKRFEVHQAWRIVNHELITIECDSIQRVIPNLYCE